MLLRRLLLRTSRRRRTHKKPVQRAPFAYRLFSATTLLVTQEASRSVTNNRGFADKPLFEIGGVAPSVAQATLEPGRRAT
jgi:hypothetical protein